MFTPKTNCKACGGPRDGYSGRCSVCVRARKVFSYYGSGRAIAGMAVAKAKKLGVMPAARLLSCVDCARAANDYDHRDYNEPLRVAPVCRRCNLSRGSAVPKAWTFEEFSAWFKAHGPHVDPAILGRVRANHFQNGMADRHWRHGAEA